MLLFAATIDETVISTYVGTHMYYFVCNVLTKDCIAAVKISILDLYVAFDFFGIYVQAEVRWMITGHYWYSLFLITDLLCLWVESTWL